MKFSPDTADCYCWTELRFAVISYGNDVCSLHFGCQEQHDPNGFLQGENIALFVYTRAGHWVIASTSPNQTWSNVKFTDSIGTLNWKMLSQNSGELDLWVRGGEHSDTNGRSVALGVLSKNKALRWTIRINFLSDGLKYLKQSHRFFAFSMCIYYPCWKWYIESPCYVFLTTDNLDWPDFTVGEMSLIFTNLNQNTFWIKYSFVSKKKSAN